MHWFTCGVHLLTPFVGKSQPVSIIITVQFSQTLVFLAIQNPEVLNLVNIILNQFSHLRSWNQNIIVTFK